MIKIFSMKRKKYKKNLFSKLKKIYITNSTATV